MLLAETTVPPWRPVRGVEDVALRRGPVLFEHFHDPLAERNVAGLLALGLAGQHREVAELRVLSGLQSHLRPFETQRLAQT